MPKVWCIKLTTACVLTLAVNAAALAQPCSDGSDGPLVVSGSITLDLPPDGVFNFTSITINPGGVLRFNRNAANTAAFLMATGPVVIAGTIQVSASGVNGGPGGGNGGLHGLGFQAGTAGGGVAGGGGGPANMRPGNAGGGGGMAQPGLTAIRWTGPFPAPGGPAVSISDPISGGSGGGGGSGWVFFGVDLSGGDGGGAGGAVHECTPASITISGAIRANGAQGGTAFANIGGHGGPGGGGSGGLIDLRADAFAVQSSGILETLGANGGGISTLPIWDPNFPSGAFGGIGYVRIRAASFENAGVISGQTDIADTCPGDVDNNGYVDLVDLTTMLSQFGASDGATFADGDADGDGDIDLGDLTSLLSHFGAVCPSD
ncbi:MAG: hypothetical protein HZB38_11065 [Planctomycetes bacterium]|nr:hypothetical protein [Planctomycetota bacterium]